MGEHGTKTTTVILPADGETSWLLLPSCGTVQPENTYCCILEATGHIVYTPFLFFGGEGEVGVEPPTKISKRRAFD